MRIFLVIKERDEYSHNEFAFTDTEVLRAFRAKAHADKVCKKLTKEGKDRCESFTVKSIELED